jgi:GumC protein
VVRQLQLWEHPYFTGGGKLEPTDANLENLSGAVLGMLGVSQIRNTQLMEVRFTSADPKLSADLANALATQFTTFNSERESNLARNTAGFIREQVEKIREIREKGSSGLQPARRPHHGDEKEMIVMKQLDHLNTEVTQARAEAGGAEALPEYRSADPGSLLEVQSHTTVEALRKSRRARTRVAVLASVQGRLAGAQEGEGILRKSREAREGQRSVARKVVAAASESIGAREREMLLAREASAEKGEAQELNKLTIDYNQIKAGIDNQRTMLQQLAQAVESV